MKENPYDIETILQTLHIAKKQNHEFLYLDMFVRAMRENVNCDIVQINYEILEKLSLMKLEKT